jgi:mannose-1-phosphate guanylyltransferase
MKIYPVILSGGAGTRLWPLSRAAMPKQLLPLVSDKTMLQDTALRLNGRTELMQPLVVCGNEHRFLVAEQMREIVSSRSPSCWSRPAAIPRLRWRLPPTSCRRRIRKP